MTSDNSSSKLLADAADCGLRITGLDGWTQTRLAGAINIRRETLNAIINRSPGSEPTPQRPRMVEACRRLITFAAALSAKEDAILKLPVDLTNLQSDDGQAYEHHRLRLHKLAEAAAAEGRYTDALCRVGEFASAALHAAPQYRLRMICNVVTAIQRLLDKPESRQVPAAVLKANLARLYRSERSARTIHRHDVGDSRTTEQANYIRGQVGYALLFTGMLLPEPRLLSRGGRRLFHAVEVQPDSSYGHWSNLLRAIDDLLVVNPALAQLWADRAHILAARQGGRACSEAHDTLKAKGEVQRLTALWNHTTVPVARLNGRRASKLAAWGIGLLLAVTCATSARAGDGRDFKNAQSPSNPPTATPAVESRARPAVTPTAPDRVTEPPRPAVTLNAPDRVRSVPSQTGFNPFVTHTTNAPPFAIEFPRYDAFSSRADLMGTSFSPQDAWGERIRSLAQSSRQPVPPLIEPKAGTAAAPAYRDDASERPMVRAPAEAARRPAEPRVALSPAAKADQALAMARNYLTAGKSDRVREKLQSIIAAYPDTAAAKEANVLLQQVASN